MTSQEEREDEVLASFVRHLEAQGIQAALHERPDRLPPAARTFPNLSSDGLLRLAGTDNGWWSCDVMALAAPDSHAAIPNVLHEDLDAVAVQHQVDICLTGAPEDLVEVKALTREIIRAINSGEAGRVTHQSAEASWQPAAHRGEVRMAIALPSPSATLTEQIAATIRQPLSKKATAQAAPARRVGCGVAVLLDGIGPTTLRQGPHWLHHSAGTVQAAVELILADVEHQLDAVYYVHRNDTWHLLHGTGPR